MSRGYYQARTMVDEDPAAPENTSKSPGNASAEFPKPAMFIVEGVQNLQHLGMLPINDPARPCIEHQTKSPRAPSTSPASQTSRRLCRTLAPEPSLARLAQRSQLPEVSPDWVVGQNISLKG